MSPDALEQASQRLQDLQEAIQSTLAAVRTAEDSLRGQWTGGASDTGNRMWTDVYEQFGKHLDTLAAKASDLRTAAGIYRAQDDDLSTDLDEQM